ncbi:hypothetical protein ACE939_08885 [Aquimarina sp. W85]|uniref:hypothetical protein n=1 Tax=Aquimarina rhodophyticola TaxID=3342246 RepID=UPI003671D858
MDKIILEDRFTTHQKITFLLYIGAPFIIRIVGLIRDGLNSNLNYKGCLALIIFLFIYSLLISIAFLKKGFIKINSNLYRGSFFREKLFLKKRIDISQTPKVAVLKFKKSQKLAWFSAAKPDLATEFNSFEINILNDKHTKRKSIIDLKKKDNVERTINFLTTNFDMKSEVFSPDFG